MYLNQWERVQSESLLDESPIITCKNLKVINNLTKKSNDNPESNTNTQSLIMIQSLTNNTQSNLKTRFFELFIENKNLIKKGLYLLEICQNVAGWTDRRDYDGPSWGPSCLP